MTMQVLRVVAVLSKLGLSLRDATRDHMVCLYCTPVHNVNATCILHYAVIMQLLVGLQAVDDVNVRMSETRYMQHQLPHCAST